MELQDPKCADFFFTVDEAVNLVVTSLEKIEEVQGKVLSRKMKAAQIEDILKIWTELKGGKYEKIEGRPGERNDEFLIGELELQYTREVIYNGIMHYLISFNEKVSKPITVGLSSANTDKLSKEEIISIVSNPPSEEI